MEVFENLAYGLLMRRQAILLGGKERGGAEPRGKRPCARKEQLTGGCTRTKPSLTVVVGRTACMPLVHRKSSAAVLLREGDLGGIIIPATFRYYCKLDFAECGLPSVRFELPNAGFPGNGRKNSNQAKADRKMFALHTSECRIETQEASRKYAQATDDSYAAGQRRWSVPLWRFFFTSHSEVDGGIAGCGVSDVAGPFFRCKFHNNKEIYSRCIHLVSPLPLCGSDGEFKKNRYQ